MPANRPSPLTVAEWLNAPNKAVPVRRLLNTESATVAKPGVLSRVVMTTQSEDRAHDTINPSGGDWNHFLANPVLLWAHDYALPPIGRVGGVEVQGSSVIGRDVQFTPREVSEFGHMIGLMYTWEPAFLRAFSIGMMPETYALNAERGGVDFQTWQALELSACNIPMNPDCLVAARSAGIDMAPWLPFAEKALDGAKDAPAWLPEREAMVVYRSLVPRMHQAPAMPDFSALTKQMETLARDVAALKAPPPPAPAPTPEPLPSINHERVLARFAERLDRRLAEVTGRVYVD